MTVICAIFILGAAFVTGGTLLVGREGGNRGKGYLGCIGWIMVLIGAFLLAIAIMFR